MLPTCKLCSIIYNRLIHNSTTKYEPSPYIPKLIKKMNDDNFMKITKYLAELTLNFGFSEKAKKFEKIFVVLLTRASCSVRATAYLSKSR